jgi:hypothetical protein
MSNKIIETIAQVYCDTSHIQGFLYGDHHVIRDLSKRPGEQEIFRASIADCSNEQFAIECSLACRRVEAQIIKDALDAAGYAIVRREPDEAMIDAAFEAVGTGANELEAERAQYRHAYQLMIAAQEQKP